MLSSLLHCPLDPLPPLCSEMPPEGKVGVSPVCILGVNINRGQEVSLRLRTDDLRGEAGRVGGCWLCLLLLLLAF